MKGNLFPLFWQHHESEEVLRQEIAKMQEGGMDGFIVEARPHPHYLKDEWWSDLACIIDEAQKRGMQVYIFDDGAYPSGYAGGIIEEQYPQHCKRYLAQRHIDAAGPLPDCSFLVGDFLAPEEELVAVVGGRRTDHLEALDPNSLTVLTSRITDGILYWDVPKGDWRIFILVKTRDGGEAHTRKYLNPLSRQAVRCYIDHIYEAHYSRFQAHFGGTVAGFFSDEPRFGSAAGYEITLGQPETVIPWCDDLMEELNAHPIGVGDFPRLLPLLWYPAKALSPDIRYLYMDVVSRRFSVNFIGQIGDWCRAHGVELIGHVVEENGAHTRLGYGAGHFFRAMEGFDTAGMDVVNNVYPGRRDGKYSTMFNYYDTCFNHWGLAKLTSSCAQLDPKKQGRAFCEAFGAYGWSEGLRLMKWITDAICVRGINSIVPHAFSPAEYPDSDCPPHFFARGKNPQWPFFHIWADYAARVCGLLSGGEHLAQVAVLYHAEAEWGGSCQPFETVVKALMENHIDSTVVCADHLVGAKSENGCLTVNGKAFGVLVVPYSQYLPPALAEILPELSGAGVEVIFTEAYPDRYYGGTAFEAARMACIPTANLAGYFMEEGRCGISAPSMEGLASCHYRKREEDIFFVTNEDVYKPVSGGVRFPAVGPVCLYDALSDRYFEAEAKEEGGSTVVSLHLEPYQSLFVLFGKLPASLARRLTSQDCTAPYTLPEDWGLSLASYGNPAEFTPAGKCRLGNVTAPGRHPRFSGLMRYEQVFSCPAQGAALLDLGRVGEIAEVRLNGVALGALICPPYRLEVPAGLLRENGNELQVDVINTLVYTNHKNPYDRYWPQAPSGLLGPVTLCFLAGKG